MRWGLAFIGLLYIVVIFLLLAGCSHPSPKLDYLDMAMLGESSEIALETRVMK